MDYLLNIVYNAYYEDTFAQVLNLIINGLPSKLHHYKNWCLHLFLVLNLIINGLPSKLTYMKWFPASRYLSFKPYYKWITF